MVDRGRVLRLKAAARKDLLEKAVVEAHGTQSCGRKPEARIAPRPAPASGIGAAQQPNCLEKPYHLPGSEELRHRFGYPAGSSGLAVFLPHSHP